MVRVLPLTTSVGRRARPRWRGRRAEPTSRPPGRRRRLVVALVAATATSGLVTGVAVAFGAGDLRTGDPTPCASGRRVLTVAAAPEIAAPVAAAVAARPPAAGHGHDGCVDVRVTPSLPADVAASLTPHGTTRPPDVWIPDSSLWLSDASRGQAAGSLAKSPVVLAVPNGVAAALGRPAGALDLASVVQAAPDLRVAFSNPSRSAVTQAGLLSLEHALSPLPDGRGRLGAVYRAAGKSLPEDSAAAVQAVTAGQLAAFAPEEAVWANNVRPGASLVVPVYPTDLPALDYPFVVLTQNAAARSDAQQVHEALTGPAWVRRVQAAGFRAPDGAAGRALRRAGLPADLASGGSPDRQAVQTAVNAFDTVTLGTRMLAVLDVSGSMATVVPGQPPRTRMRLALDAAVGGLALYPDDAEVGLWEFSTALTPTTDYRELVPVGPLGVQPDGVYGRQKLAAALAQVSYVQNGDTGLYDTVLAAVRTMRQGWQPGRVNSVVVMTDGRNDDVNGISLAQLNTALSQEEGDKPVPVIGIALGSQADIGALQDIAQATRGAAYEVRDERQIPQVLAEALAQRPCRPYCTGD